MDIPQQIERFVRQHRVLTLATCVAEEPWCAHCFYVYMPEHQSFFFASDSSTKHIEQACHNLYVAAGIALESRWVGRLRGLQMQGFVVPPAPELQQEARRAYVHRFPVARLMQPTLWQFSPVRMKYTDNRLGFGKKLHWTKEDELGGLLASVVEAQR